MRQNSVSTAIVLSLVVFALQAGESRAQTFDAKGVKIHYLVAGKGQPVVLIHGLYSSAVLNWKAFGVVDELAKDHQVAVTEQDLKKIDLPVEVLVGGRDPVKKLYVLPLHQVRKDWPIVEIPDAGHLDCIAKPQFRAEIAAWVRKNSK